MPMGNTDQSVIGSKTLVMGVLNVTPENFPGEGNFGSVSRLNVKENLWM